MVDVAKLVFEFDATSAATAEKQIDKLAATSDRLQQAAKRARDSMSGGAFEQATRSAGAYEQSLKALVGAYQQGRDALGRFTGADGAFQMSQAATARLLLQNAKAAEALAKEQDAAARAVQRLTSSYDPLAGEVLKVNRQLAEAEKLFSKGAISVDQYGTVADGLRQKLANLETAQATGVKSSKALQMATLNLGRQFTDIGVQLAGGQNPFLVLVQQTPQIIDGFEVAKMQGLSFKAVLAGIGTTIAPFLPALIAIGTVAGVAFGGAALAARALNQDNKNLAASLGLTEKQMDRLKDKGVETGVTIGDVFKGTFNYIAGAVKPILDPVKKWFGELFDDITKGSIGAIKAIVGGFMGAFASVKAIWSDFPAVMGDLFISGVNLAIGAIEKLLNSTTAGINALIEKANAVSAKVNGPQIGTLAAFKLDPINNPYAGAYSKAGQVAGREYADGVKRGAAAVDSVVSGIGASILKTTSDRLKKAAGDAEKATKKHTEAIRANEVAIVGLGDNTFEFTRDLERQVAAMGQSKETQMELAYQTARLGATTDDQLERLDRAYAAWKAQNRVLKDAEKVQKEVDAQQRDNIKTVHDAKKGLDEHKRSLEEVSWAYERAFRSAGDFFGAVASGDVGGSIGGLSNLLKDAGKLAGADSGIGKALGKAGAFLGPVGEAVTAVTSVLGVIGAKSAEKAQAKLDALNKGVEDLRAANMAASNSIKGALDEANRAWNADLEYSSQIVTSLRSIDTQIGSLAVAVSNSITTGNLLSTSGLGLGTSGSGAGGLLGAVGALLFGNTKTSTQLLDQGLAFAPGTYAQGVTGSTYADLATTKTKSLLGVAYSTKVSNSTVSGALSGDLLAQVNAVIKSLGDGVLSAASVFGVEAAKAAESALGSAVVDLGKLSLKDLKPDEIAAVLQATFDKVGDQLAAAGVPGLDKLGQVGEGTFETLTRVAREYQVVDVALASIGKTFGAVGLESLAARDGLVQLLGGVEEFSSKTGFFAANFLTDAERLAPIQKAVNDNLAAYGLSAASSRDQFKALVLAQDLTTESGRNAYAALLNIAPAFDKVAKASEAVAQAEADLNATRLEAQRRADDEAKRLADETAAAFQQTNIGLMRQLMAMDDAVLGTTSARDAARADELAKLDETGRKLQAIIWARQDEAEVIAKQQAATEAATAAAEEAARKTAEILKQRTDLENQLLVALGMTALATERQRAAMLEGMDPSLRGYQSLLFGVEDATAAVTAAEQALTDARSAASQAYERETSAIQGTIDKFKSFSTSLKAFRGSLDTGSLGNLNPLQQYAKTKADFERVAGLAASGNEEALGSLQGVSEAYLEASKNAQATNVGYFKDLAAVKRATEAASSYADKQVDQGSAQLAALQAQVSGLGILNQSTLSVGAAVANVASAIDALARATSAKAAADAAAKNALANAGVIPKAAESLNDTSRQVALSANDNAALAAAKVYYNSANGGIDSALFNRYFANDPFGKSVGFTGDPEELRKRYGFATGGSFTVGGSGGPDSQFVPLHLSPGEVGNITRPDVMAALLDEMRGLRQANDRLEARLAGVEANTKRGADAAQDSALVLEGAARGQLTLSTEAA